VIFMNDKGVLDQIQRLVAEEHKLLEKGEDTDLQEQDRGRLREIEISLDQCWDLLRQRRARREFGQDPDEAHVRDATTVERFQQ
jgi:uncharacterized glyoxalase superfamily metalloenzyme YdcJ